MAIELGKVLFLFASIGLTSCSGKSWSEDECKTGQVCTLASQHETYLDLRVVNMTKRPIRLPALHGVGSAELPGVFVMDFSESDTSTPPGPNPPPLGNWESLTLYPKEGISFALSWGQYRKIFEHESGCKKVTANFIINSWARQGIYHESPITPAKLLVCVPSSKRA